MDSSAIFDTGLTVVHEPQDSDSSPSLVDIVFIHGLQGHPYRTWAHRSPPKQSGQPQSASNPATSTSSTKRSIGGKLRRLAARLRKTRAGSPLADEQAVQNPETVNKRPKSVFWPADLLPQICPRARILVWGYDTRVTRSLGEAVNKSNIFAHGKDLLYAFRRERDLDVPVFFVAHSLGGIVLKEALKSSYHSGETDLENIAKSTKAVIFMGTPHRGSQDMAGVGEIARRVASAFMADTKSAMLDSLGLKNSDLERCQDSFTRIWQKFEFSIKTFQEGLPLAGVNLGLLNDKVVPDFSSLLGDPREHAETLQANHMEMCRFQGELDPNYRKVGGELKFMYGSIAQMCFTPPSEGQAQLKRYIYFDCHEHPEVFSLRYRDVRGWLYFSELGQQQNTVEKAFKDTCQRLLKSETYEAWSNRQNLDQHQGLLWIKGKPGSGKSTLIKEAVMRTRASQTSRDQIIISFFFNARGHELEKTAIGFFRALLYQLLPRFRERVQEFIDSCHHKKARNDEVAWNLQELKNSIRTIFAEPSEEQVFVFVDALDECEDRPREIVQFLRELTADAYSAGVNLNICMSSRFYPTITISRYLELVMEDYNGPDIALFVEKRLSMAIDEDCSLHIHPWAHIKKEIIERASGIFLWARLVLDLLLADYDKGKSIESLEALLFSVPQALGDLYSEILQRIHSDERDETARFFAWVLLATRPIQLREWYQLLAFIGDSPPKSLAEWKCSEDFVDSDDQLLRRVRCISRGLVEVQKPERALQAIILDDERDSILAVPGSLDLDNEGTGTLQFIHESVREFFLYSGGIKHLFPHGPTNAIGQAHLSILNTCFDYLSIKELDELADARMVATPSEISVSSGISLVKPSVRVRRRKSISSMKSHHSCASSVGSSASNYARTIHSQGSNFNTTELPQNLPARWPSRKETAREPMMTVMQHLESSWESPQSPMIISSVASFGQISGKILEEIPCLFHYTSEAITSHAILAEREGCDPSELINGLQDGNIWARRIALCDGVSADTSLLYFAAENGLISWASCLLAAGTRLRMCGGKFGHPLIVAAHKGNGEMLHLLLQDPTDINAWDPQYQTILHHLAAASNHVLLESILENYAEVIDINAKDLHDKMPLHVAAYRSNKETVEVLVAHGALLNAPDKGNSTPLHLACRRKVENLDVVRCLVDLGANLREVDDYGRMLRLAMLKGFDRSATFLQQHIDSLPQLPDLVNNRI